TVDVLAHLRVPALGLVPEMDARFEELTNAERLARVAKLASVGVDRGALRDGFEAGIARGRRLRRGWVGHAALSFRFGLRPASGPALAPPQGAANAVPVGIKGRRMPSPLGQGGGECRPVAGESTGPSRTR